MKEIKHYMDEAIQKGIVKNDSALAKKLGLSRASVSWWRSGKSAPDDEQAIGLARLIGKPEIELMAEAAAHRAKTPESRTYWERIAKYSATFASAVVMVISSMICVTYPTESQASYSAAGDRVFIMSIWRYLKALKTALSEILAEMRQPRLILGIG